MRPRAVVPRALAALFLLFAAAAHIGAEQLIDRFDNLAGWKELSFQNIDTPTLYESSEEGELLRVSSEGGASMLLFQQDINVYQTPQLSWRWRVTEDLERQSLRTRAGDDAPIRVYVAFRRPLSERGFGERLWAGFQKNLYGEIPPDSVLSFVWSSREPSGAAFQSAYTDQQYLLIPKVTGDGDFEVGLWLEHKVDLLDAYRRLFGEDPPTEAFIAVMGDSDNTNGSSEAWLDYLHLRKE